VHHTPDGGAPDALPDSATSTGIAPPGAVTIKITRAGMPLAGVAVFFQGPDSTPISTVLTDDVGSAWAVMPAGGFVTAR
jgi:hypothetical protein